MAGGAVLSCSPETISIGPRPGFLLSALASVKGLTFAVAAWNSGVPEAGAAEGAGRSLGSSSPTGVWGAGPDDSHGRRDGPAGWCRVPRNRAGARAQRGRPA